jgi:hypothetical protein
MTMSPDDLSVPDQQTEGARSIQQQAQEARATPKRKRQDPKTHSSYRKRRRSVMSVADMEQWRERLHAALVEDVVTAAEYGAYLALDAILGYSAPDRDIRGQARRRGR